MSGALVYRRTIELCEEGLGVPGGLAWIRAAQHKLPGDFFYDLAGGRAAVAAHCAMLWVAIDAIDDMSDGDRDHEPLSVVTAWLMIDRALRGAGHNKLASIMRGHANEVTRTGWTSGSYLGVAATTGGDQYALYASIVGAPTTRAHTLGIASYILADAMDPTPPARWLALPEPDRDKLRHDATVALDVLVTTAGDSACGRAAQQLLDAGART